MYKTIKTINKFIIRKKTKVKVSFPVYCKIYVIEVILNKILFLNFTSLKWPIKDIFPSFNYSDPLFDSYCPEI